MADSVHPPCPFYSEMFKFLRPDRGTAGRRAPGAVAGQRRQGCPAVQRQQPAAARVSLARAASQARVGAACLAMRALGGGDLAAEPKGWRPLCQVRRGRQHRLERPNMPGQADGAGEVQALPGSASGCWR
jgi:hypothetical protein